MHDNIKYNSSDAIFIRWDELDKRIKEWSGKHFNSYSSCGARDDNDLTIEVTFRGCNTVEANALMDALYEKYDVDKDFEADHIHTPFGVVEFAPPVTLGIMNEIFAESKALSDFKAKRAVALYDGVLFFSSDIIANI